MFRSARRCAASPAAIFLTQSKGKFSGKARLEKVWHAYSMLDVDGKVKLLNTAAVTTFKHTAAFEAKKARSLEKRSANVQSFGKHPYAAFVKANYKNVVHLASSKRFKAIAKLWKESKQPDRAAAVPEGVAS
jgi:hypothetical protein